MTLTVGSLFSGVGGFDLGFERAGFDVRWQCEIDRQCRDVLTLRFPNVEVIYSNVCTMPLHNVERVDVAIGGFPCTDVSISGRRAGLAGAHSGLFFPFARAIRELRPAIVVIENVTGLLTSNARRDFAVVLGTLRELGAVDIGWRVLDAQWFGVAQQRNRVFIVADFRGERAGEILALSEGVQGLPQPRRETGQADTAFASSGPRGGGVSHALTAGGGGVSGKERQQTVIAFSSQSGGDVRPNASEHVSPTLSASQIPAIAFRTSNTAGNEDNVNRSGVAFTLDAGHGLGQAVAYPLVDVGARGWSSSVDSPNLVVEEHRVRRLTPLENERLQGLPDFWTEYGASGKRMADATRYRMCGNAVPVTVAEYLARRAMAVMA